MPFIKMESYKPILILIIAIVGTYTCSSTRENVIDFTKPENSIPPKHISLIAPTMIRDSEISIICPKVIDGRSYSLYPFDPLNYAIKPFFGDGCTCIGNSYELKTVRTDEILGSLHGNLIKFEDLDDVQKLTISYPPNEFIIRRESMYLVYLCADTEDASNESYLEILGKNMTEALIASVLLPLLGEDYVPALTSGVGMVFLNLDELPCATHGCSTAPSQLFLNEQQFDQVEKTFSAELDVMLTPRIGFYCDGDIDAGILLTRFGGNSRPFLAYHEYPVHDNDELGAKIAFISFSRTGLIYPFEEKFYCRDRETGDIKGSITLRRTRDLVCDINSMLMKNRLRPYLGNWYDVVLHPGDVLTIKFPPENGYYDARTEEYKHLEGHEDEAFVSTIFPRFIRGDYKPELIVAGASLPWASESELCRFIDVDESQRHRGQIVFKFIEDGLNDDMAFYSIYHCEWRGHRIGTDVYDIVAPIKLQFVFSPHRE